MKPERKSTVTSRQSSEKVVEKEIPLDEALVILGIRSTKEFAARKLFERSMNLSEKEWNKLFIKHRIIHK